MSEPRVIPPEPAWQWDVGLEVTVAGAEPGDVVDFARAGECAALSVTVSADGAARVPSSLLRCAGQVACWVRRGDRTCGHAVVSVRPRAKPAGYADAPDEVMTWESLDASIRAWVEERLAAGGGTGGGKVQEVEPPLELEGGRLTVDLSRVRGTQVTTGDGEPSSAANRGDSYIRTNGEIWEFTDIPGTD